MTDPLNPQGQAIPSASGEAPGSNTLTDATLGADQGDSQLDTPDGEPRAADQGGLSSDEGSASTWDYSQDLSIADEERDSVLPNHGEPVTDDLGRLHPETDPMSNDNR